MNYGNVQRNSRRAVYVPLARDGSFDFPESPKDECPSYPVLSEYDVLEKIVTSSRAFSALEHGDDTLYFKKFDDEMDPSKEFRVFIHNGNMTAISTYSTEVIGLTDKQAEETAGIIYNYWKELTFHDKLPASYTMDVYMSNEPHLIEFNSFGYWLAAGSCLFDWLDDYDILYSAGKRIVFRLAGAPPPLLRVF